MAGLPRSNPSRTPVHVRLALRTRRARMPSTIHSPPFLPQMGILLLSSITRTGKVRSPSPSRLPMDPPSAPPTSPTATTLSASPRTTTRVSPTMSYLPLTTTRQPSTTPLVEWPYGVIAATSAARPRRRHSQERRPLRSPTQVRLNPPFAAADTKDACLERQRCQGRPPRKQLAVLLRFSSCRSMRAGLWPTTRVVGSPSTAHPLGVFRKVALSRWTCISAHPWRIPDATPNSSDQHESHTSKHVSGHRGLLQARRRCGEDVKASRMTPRSKVDTTRGGLQPFTSTSKNAVRWGFPPRTKAKRHRGATGKPDPAVAVVIFPHRVGGTVLIINSVVTSTATCLRQGIEPGRHPAKRSAVTTQPPHRVAMYTPALRYHRRTVDGLGDDHGGHDDVRILGWK